MFRFAFAAAAVLLVSTPPAFATHLGPIEFGKERVESVFLCIKKDDAIFLATEERRSIDAKESTETFLGRISHLVTEKRCGMADLAYTPRETIHQWTGRMVRDNKIVETHMSIVRSDSEFGEVFVLTPDPAPAPKNRK